MSDINDQSSDTSSEISWPLDGSVEQYDRVVFENVADQYVKGEDVTVFFTITSDIKVNPNEDHIGILRVGASNMKESIAYAPIQFNPSITSGSTRHGTATFPSSALSSANDDEFYQFCYLINKTKNLGSSIPFQLNCALDDIDLLSNGPVRKTKPDGLIALADHDNEDVVIIHTKRMLTEEKLRQENRQLSDMNRRLELQKEECESKLDILQTKTKEQLDKVYHDMQSLAATHKTTIDELHSRQQTETKLRHELDDCLELCKQYQIDSVQNAERCQALEQAKSDLTIEANQIHSRFNVTSQLVKDQATKIVELERRVVQSDELTRNSTQVQSSLEQQIRDLRLTSEKHQFSLQGQVEAQSKNILEQKDRINSLENENQLLQEEINNVKWINEHLLADTKQAYENMENLQKRSDQSRRESELAREEIEILRKESSELRAIEEAHNALKTSFEAIKTRCLKHQKSEVDAKKQLSVYKSHVTDLQREIDELTERLNAGAYEYKTLFRKYTTLEQTKNIKAQEEPITTILTNDLIPKDEELYSLLRNSYDLPLEKKEEEQEAIAIPSTRPSFADVEGEVQKCPMCYYQFPEHMTLDTKRQHIEEHFEN